MLQQSAVSLEFLNESTFLQGVLARSGEAAEKIYPQYVPTATEGLLLFHGTAYASGCMQERCLYAKPHLKPGSWTGLAVQLVIKTWSTLTMSVGLGILETGYFLYLIQDGRTSLLHVIALRSNDFSPVSRRTSLDGVGHPLKTEAKMDRAK